MTSDDSSPHRFWAEITPFIGLDFEHTMDMKQSESETYEAQLSEELQLPDHNHNDSSPMRTGGAKRKEQCAKGKSNKKQRRTFHRHNGESSASQQQPEPKKKDFKDIMEEKSVPELVKILKDRVNRRRNNDEKAYMENLMRWLSARKLIKWPLPPQSDLEDIQQRIKKIESDSKEAADRFSSPNSDIKAMELANGYKQELNEAREALEKLSEQRQKDSIKTKNLEAIFTTNEDISVETQKEKFSSAFPGFLGETATNGLAIDHDQGSFQTCEQLQSTFSNLKNQLYAMDNNKVDISDFHGLKEALDETTWRKTPDYLELIAIRIEKTRGKATEALHKYIEVLVCAAIQEMEDLKVENLEWATLKKWGATLNIAKQQGFQVEFADNLLSKNFHAYVALLKMGPEIKGG